MMKQHDASGDLHSRFFPEARIDGYSFIDGTIAFYLKIKTLYAQSGMPRVLDYGAGRGVFMEDASETRKWLHDLRVGAKEVIAVDIDEAVLQNTASHRQLIIDPHSPLPFKDNYFDIIVSDFVFEHVSNPEHVSRELLRVLVPGGWICARTANKFGYVAVMSRLIPDIFQRRALRHIQPERKSIDIFPAMYKLCSLRAFHEYFPGKAIIAMTTAGEPHYHFNNVGIYRLFLFLHRLMPSRFLPGLVVFIQK